jgi:hypothetical protein
MNVKVFRSPQGLRQALGQSELVFGSDLGKHRFVQSKESFLYRKTARLLKNAWALQIGCSALAQLS